MSAALQRLGMFGGAFDPPHNAHVALVAAAIEQLKLDALHVCPTGQAWHKPQRLSAPEHRLAMARLAFGDLPRVVVDDREMRRAGPTYTIDTLLELRGELAPEQLFLVLGADQAAALPRWHRWDELLQVAIISIAGRPQLTGFDEAIDVLTRHGARFDTLQLPPMAVSATGIRELAAQAQGIAHLVPPGVASYIDQHHLYATA